MRKDKYAALCRFLYQRPNANTHDVADLFKVKPREVAIIKKGLKIREDNN